MKVAELKSDIRDKLQEHHAAVAASPPRLVALTAAARSLLLFPSTGVVTDDDVLVGLTGGVPVGTVAHAHAAKTALDALNRLVVNKTGICLPYRHWVDARLTSRVLQSLLFVRQYERFAELQQLRDERIRESPAIRIRISVTDHEKAIIVEGHEFLRVEGGDDKLGSFICYLAEDAGAPLNFVDLNFCKEIWKRKNTLLPQNITILDIVDADTTDKQTTIVLARKSGAMLQKGQEYIIRPRYIDFLLERVATTLRALDCDPENILVQLLSDPNLEVPFPYAPAQNLAQQLQNPDCLQQFSPSQRAAFEHAQAHRVQVLWGPPGTGKTNYLSISLLHWLQAAISSTPDFLVIVTAFTKHAIRELLRSLRVHYQKWVDSTQEKWPTFADLCTFAVSEFEDREAHKEGGYTLLSEPKDFAIGGIQILCGTVHQLAKYRERMVMRGGADMLIIDEGSQMLLADAAIPISLLNKLNGRMVIAGDHLQLPPILKAEYPPTEPGRLNLTTSVLQAFLSAGTRNPQADFLTITQRECPVLTQLTENWRSNKQIGDFTRRLYHTGYDLPERPVDRMVPNPDLLSPNGLLTPVLQTHLSESPLALVVIEVRTAGNMLHAEVERRVEASLVRRLVQELRDACPNSPCYVPTPHRAQRFFISKRLAEWTNTTIEYKGKPMPAVQVDTVDRMQGREASCVLISALLTDPDLIASEAGFIFSLPRLNVAMSRAKCLCIFLASSTILAASPEVLRNKLARAGYTHMLAFLDSAGAKISVEVDPSATSAKAFLQTRANGSLSDPILMCEFQLD
eukprot:Phypoly_transcript_02964.p1 GENE.Phypoly_transcript_02964~~Phypoly_transcript_02964.p1  ORF type:complete len:860 (+),score=170.77 Phypoly_transcript_02964:192-2582(+)